MYAEEKGKVIRMNVIDSSVRIDGVQVYLRPITVEDTDVVLRWRNAPHVVENFIYREPITREEHLAWLEQKVFVGKVIQFIICDKETDQALGSAYLQNIEDKRKLEYGIFLGESIAFGRGIGSEVAKLIVDYAFGTLGAHKVFSRVLACNKASIGMLKKVGYKQEGYLVDELFLDGKYEDLTVYAIINPEK